MSPPDPAADPPPFAAPWQAQAFALAQALRAAGRLRWSDFTRELGAALPPDGDGGSGWHLAHLEALERACAAAGLVAPGEIAARAEAWRAAYARTPHGREVRLEADGGGA